MVLYASQTGTAHEIAKGIAAEAAAEGLNAKAVGFNEFGFENLTPEKAPVVVIVASSTGDGDPPDNAAKFLVTLKRKTNPAGMLKGIKYTCLGLGDSNYTRFCAVPKAFCKRFNDLGAECFFPTVDVDEVDGIEEVVDAWCEKLKPVLKAACSEEAGGTKEAPPPPAPAAGGAPSLAAAAAAAPTSMLTGSAALMAKMQAERAKPQPKSKAVMVLYASQTGTAHEIAKGIAAEAAAEGLNAKAVGFNEFGFENLTPEKAPVVVIVASSTGDGDPPDNAAKFLVTLKRKTNPAGMLKGIKYTCLGLGDSNYTRFCAVPKAFCKRFNDLGAECFFPTVDVDEVDGIEEVVDAWCEKLKPVLKAACSEEAGGTKEAPPPPAAAQQPAEELVGVPALSKCTVTLDSMEDATAAAVVQQAERSHPTSEELAHRDPEGIYAPDAPFWAPVVKCHNMCSESSDREVLHLEIDLSGSGMACHPGDAIGIKADNDPTLVDKLLALLAADGSQVFSVAGADGEPGKLSHLGWPCTLRHAFAAGCDITGVPKKSLLRMLAEYCSDAAEKNRLLYLSSRGGKEAYRAEMVAGQPSLVDLLEQFPSCKPPVAHLLEALTPLATRLYSLTSSPLQHPDAAHVAFSVVKYRTERYGDHAGVATNYIKRVCSGATSPKLAVFLRSNESFRPPSDLSAPLIMIGPGTGVAPFRGFLQERAAKARAGAALGPSWLFFGCRNREEDFLYRNELEGFAASGHLTHLVTAFSREGADKVYVQHRMKGVGAQLSAAILDQGGYVMICGDGAHMAKDVNQCLVDILVEHGGLSAQEATAKLAEMTKQRRYVRDIWS